VRPRPGSTIPINDLEAHYLAGGDVVRVVIAIISADKANIPMPFNRAAAIDLAGRDIVEAVKMSVIPKVIETPKIAAVAKDGIQLIAFSRVTVRTNIDRLVGGAGEETIIARVGEGMVSTIGSAATHKNVLENPDHISKHILSKGLDSGTAYEILSIDIADVDVGENIGAKLQIDQANADKQIAQAKAEERRAMAVALEQEMRARVVEAEAEVPRAMAEAFRQGNLGIMDYYKMKNVQADTAMRDAIAWRRGTGSCLRPFWERAGRIGSRSPGEHATLFFESRPGVDAMIARPALSTNDTAAQHDAPGGPPWHTVEPDAIAVRLETSSHGLSRDEARRRLERDGPNQLAETPPTSPFIILLHQFRSPLIYILLAATLVTLLLEEFIDAGVIAAVLALNAIIGFTQERRAEQSVRALMRLMAPKARVVRGGREWSIDSRDLVAGDVVLLESGARVPADLRLFSTTALRVDESLLTGESLLVTKTTAALDPPERPLADRTNMVFMGTVAASGRGRGYVVTTGVGTELGAIAESIRGGPETESPLQHRMKRFAHVIGIAVFLSASAALAIGVSLGQSPSQMFMVAVALAVAAVPEGLPVVFTITLALAVRRMAKRHAIVRRLPAVETLGSTTVIGSDKTGTLTENRMTVQEVWAGGQTMTVGASGPTALREPPVLASATPARSDTPRWSAHQRGGAVPAGRHHRNAGGSHRGRIARRCCSLRVGARGSSRVIPVRRGAAIRTGASVFGERSGHRRAVRAVRQRRSRAAPGHVHPTPGSERR
jgi:uncharacterized protein YqfA (UPF0365 family)